MYYPNTVAPMIEVLCVYMAHLVVKLDWTAQVLVQSSNQYLYLTCTCATIINSPVAKNSNNVQSAGHS